MRASQRIFSTLVALPLLAFTRVASAFPVGSFDLAVPPGWAPIAEGSVDAAIRRAAPQLVASLADTRIAFAAADLRAADLATPPNLNVTLTDGKVNITQAFVDGMANKLSGMFKEAFHADVQVAQTAMITVGGVDCGRATFDMSAGGKSVREVQYYVPGERQLAVVTYVFPGDTATASFPLAEVAMQATRGAVSHSPLRAIGRTALIGGVIGGLGGALATLVTKLRKRAA